MLHKTDALVLRIWPHSNTSQIVSWLTPLHGRISTLNKGALRPKSPFLGQCDLFYRCELVYYTRSKTDLYIAKEIAAIETRNHFRDDWRASSLASYWSDLLQHTSVAMESHETVFRLANDVLNSLTQDARLALVLLWGELQLLAELGLAPQLQKCVVCHATGDDGRFSSFSAPRGGVVCSKCAHNHTRQCIHLPADVLAILRRLQMPKSTMRSLATTDSQLRTLQGILGQFHEHHLDMSTDTRTLALNALRRTPARPSGPFT